VGTTESTRDGSVDTLGFSLGVELGKYDGNDDG